MKPDIISPYQEYEPYAYLSYAHADRETVYRIARKLQNRGYRIWFDDGISVGSIWMDEIINRLSHSAVYIAFISRSFTNSINCASELRYALDMDKPIIYVLLEEFELPSVLQYFLTGYPCINFSDNHYDITQLCEALEHNKLREDNTVPLNELKVVFLGDGDSGKSHTIARLLNDGGDPLDYTDQSTPGIVIKNKKYELDGQNIQIHYWDFGGQEILHSMHRIFLTERTLYVVLVNARDETQDARARYWLHNIQSFAKDAPVVLVLNKMDQNPKASLNEPDLRAKYPGLKQVVKLSALKDSEEEFSSKLTDVLLEEIRNTGNLNIRWPKHWLRVKRELEQMETHYIHGDRYQEICRDCSVESNQQELLHWFNDLGVSFCCDDDYRLEDYVILKPDWITNALYITIFNECEGARNGLLPHSSILSLLKDRDSKKIRRVLPNVGYNWNETQYVLNVIRRFRLSFEGKSGYEFIPMLCQREAMPVAMEYANDPDTLEFQMEFDYLPNNVLHRLMVERNRELCMDQVWLTGALFRQEGTGLTAVVTIDDNLLRIFVKKGDPMHRPNTYLSMLMANVEQISESMNLKPPIRQMVYKLEGKQELFELDLLNDMLQDQETDVYARTWRKRLSIWDILNQAAPAASDDQNRLVRNMVTACLMLQADKNYWGTEENRRNTFLRNALRMAGYVVHDQTLQGLSGGGIREGEIDLDIRRYENQPWSICEALRISDGSKTNWNKHLEKLLDNYNPSGASFLFLVSYVDCEKDKFEHIWDSFEPQIKNHGMEQFACIRGSYEPFANAQWADNHFIKTVRCQYKCGSYTPTVYHIFVRMGR